MKLEKLTTTTKNKGAILVNEDASDRRKNEGTARSYCCLNLVS